MIISIFINIASFLINIYHVSILIKYIKYLYKLISLNCNILYSFFSHINKLYAYDNKGNKKNILFLYFLNKLLFNFYNKKFDIIRVKYFNGQNNKYIIYNNYELSQISNKKNDTFYQNNLFPLNIILKNIYLNNNKNINLAKYFTKYFNYNNSNNIKNIFIIENIKYKDEDIITFEYFNLYKKMVRMFFIESIIYDNIKCIFDNL
jgi:hypothetical protein